MEEAGEDSEEDKEEQEEEEGEGIKSSNEESVETPMKPPARTQVPAKTQAKTNMDEGMEGMADNEELFQCKGDVHHKIHKPGEHPTKRARAETCIGQSASEKARAAGDFGTPWA